MNSGSRWPSIGRPKASTAAGTGCWGRGPSGAGRGAARPATLDREAGDEAVEDVGLGHEAARRRRARGAGRRGRSSRRRSRRRGPPRGRGCGCDRRGASVASVRNTSSAAARVRSKWWSASRSYSARPISTAATVVTVPATPTSVRCVARTPGPPGAARRRRRWPRRWRSRAPRARAGRWPRCFSVRRTHPMSSERTASTPVVPTMNSVEPPPMSTTRNGPSAGSRSAVAPANDSRPSSSPLSSSGRTPTIASAASKKSARLVASRAAEVAVMRSRSTPCASMRQLVLAERGEGPLDGGRVEPAGGVDALARVG